MRIQLPYNHPQLVSILHEVEFPLLSHLVDSVGNNLFQYLIDIEEEYFQFIVFRVTELDFFRYLNNTCTLREIVLSEDKEFIYYTESADFSVGESEFRTYTPRDLPTEFLPGKNSYFAQPFPDKYIQLIEKHSNSYVTSLKQRGVVLRIAPKNQKFSHTVTVENIADFTKDFNSSYESYVKQKFYETFKKDIGNEKEFESTKKKVLAKATPRVCDLQFGSFELTLSNDILNSEGLSPVLVDWTNDVLKKYAKEVLFIDYGSEQIVSRLIKEVTPLELKDVYEPIINAISRKDYYLEVREVGTANKIEFKSNYRKVKKKIRTHIQTTIPGEEEPVKKKFIHTIYAVSENAKRPKASDMVTAFVSNETEINIEEINRPEANYKLNPSLSFTVHITPNGKFIVEDDEYNISVEVDDPSLVVDSLKGEINRIIDTDFKSDSQAFFTKYEITYQ